jgi:hypothetical protein
MNVDPDADAKAVKAMFDIYAIQICHMLGDEVTEGMLSNLSVYEIEDD